MLLTRKNTGAAVGTGRLSRRASGFLGQTLDRRAFLKRSGLTVGAGAAISQLPLTMMERADAAQTPPAAGAKLEVHRTVCTHCSVGCAIDGVVQNGVWIRQEPVFESPLNMGSHCAKGAAARDHGIGTRRLKYPMKLVNGKYQRISWDQALNEVTGKISELAKANGKDSIYWIGSSKHSNEQSYLLCKFVRLFGSNNCDHQARICHSTTVAGVANTQGYGAMTNSYNDEQNSKCMLFLGSNAADAHPVSMLHSLHAKENGAKMIVVEPRFTKTAAKADEYHRIRSGTDVAFIYGMLYHIFKNGWEDKRYIDDRVYGMNQVRDEVMKYTPDVVKDICGTDEKAVHSVAEAMAKNKPSTIIWAMGQTQHSNGNGFVRASCILQLALGNTGIPGGGTNIYRGHDNVQGATDIGPNPESLPGYYGVSEGAFKHWCGVWDIDYEWLRKRFDSDHVMHIPGITVSRWIDGVLYKNDVIDQGPNLHAVIYWGHAPNSQSRGLEMAEAMKKLDLLVVIDPYPSATAAMAAMVRKDGVYLLPAASQYETSGSVTASNRSLQWRDKVIEPMFESKPDQTIMYLFAKKFGFEKELCKHIKVNNDEPLVEDITREFNRGNWTIGYTGQSPERLKLHMANMHTFDVKTLRAKGGPCDGDYFGLPWPCWGTAELKHPGTPNLYQISRSVQDGGLAFRANWGVERNGESMLAGDGSAPKDGDLTSGYPEFDHVFLKKLGWWNELTDAEKKAADGRNWKTDLSGGIQRVVIKHNCSPFGNGRARAVVWNFPDPVPIHREPIFSPRPDLVAKFPANDDKKVFWRLPTLFKSLQEQNVKDGVEKKYPLVMTSGRMVEYEGGGDETRSNPWLAELQQEMYVEINVKDANDRGVVHEQYVWVTSPEKAKLKVKAHVTERVGPGEVFLPFHFAGWWEGTDLLDKYPEGAAPYVRGEAMNTATTYGYDAVTMMQETKTTLCQVSKA
ncbi:MAG TPA: formate dehydrogenase subunit alpha [Burkholderiales bacterium]|jgi:formate dehydrogenase major subunit|nr:formate dehydrogenase subunit alpha [Burkholderiales bacterium]